MSPPQKQSDTQCVQRAQDQADLGPRLALFHLHHPLAADADTVGQGLLPQAQPPPVVADHGAQVARGAYQHRFAPSNVVIRRHSTDENER